MLLPEVDASCWDSKRIATEAREGGLHRRVGLLQGVRRTARRSSQSEIWPCRSVMRRCCDEIRVVSPPSAELEAASATSRTRPEIVASIDCVPVGSLAMALPNLAASNSSEPVRVTVMPIVDGEMPPIGP